MAWRVAKSLLHLRDQVNAQRPVRDKSSDGTIGDAAHAARTSDHNPWVQDGEVGVVTALDITNDPEHQVVSNDIAEVLRKSKDSRIKYIISNKRIATAPSFQWRAYSGSNPHDQHVHISVQPQKRLYDSEKDWPLPEALGGEKQTVPDTISEAVSIGDMSHLGEQSDRVKKIQNALNKAGANLLALDGNFGPLTEAAVKIFQQAKGLTLDGIVGPATAAELDKYLSSTPPPPVSVPLASDWKEGRGSWYSQYNGKHKWRDPGDKPGSAALGTPDDAQGVSFFNWATLGKWFEVEYPNGHRSIEQQTDVGPSPWTGKKIDISAAAADRAGYSPDNFPTGATFKWRQVPAPTELAGLTPREQSVKYRDIRLA